METYGKWEVIGTPFAKKQRTHVLCRCECGVEKELALGNLKRGLSTQCSDCRYKNRGPNLNARKTGTHLAAMDKMSDYKVKASQRGITFELSFEEFLEVTAKDCFYCGRAPENVNKLPKKEWAEDFVYSGIDRLDNQHGYHYDNCVPCCKTCNYSKRDLTFDQFIENCYRVASLWPHLNGVVT